MTEGARKEIRRITYVLDYTCVKTRRKDDVIYDRRN